MVARESLTFLNPETDLVVEDKITFGTDGWRGIIADSFTFENIALATKAIADYVLSKKVSPRIVVGYDTRFMSERFAKIVCEVLAGEGIDVLMADGFTPTPVISFAVCDKQADGGIVITASHNPAIYNGLKFKAPYGGSANPKIMKEIEAAYEHNLKKDISPKSIPFDQAAEEGRITKFDPLPDYFDKVFSLLKKSEFDHELRVLIDPMFGAGQGHLKSIINSLGCDASEIHGRILPSFGGVSPEPIELNLTDLKRSVIDGGFDLGLALDGDADRIGAIDDKGNFVDSHKIFSLLLRYLAETKGLKGRVVKTVSTTQMVDRLAKKYGLPLVETPIGFKYICDEILEGGVLIGGEESGGISIKGHIPERDGILMGCLIVEVVSSRGIKLSDLVKELNDDFGPTCYRRIDVNMNPEKKEILIDWLENQSFSRIGGRIVVRKNFKDGYKFFFEDDNWLLIRPSGTEPVVRVYAEAEESSKVDELLAIGLDIMKRSSEG